MSYRLGSWLVEPELNRISGADQEVRLEPKVMEVLDYLAQRPGEVLPKERLLQAVWPDTFVIEHVLTRAISELRKALGDDSQQPAYIQTIPRRGYRLVAEVQAVEAEPVRYRILKRLGSGAMGEVYLAEDRRLGRNVALKFLPEDLQNDPSALRRFEREARTAAAIDHPFLCKVYETGLLEGREYIALEYVEGKPLKEQLLEGPLPVARALEIAGEMAEALVKAHESGVVHRDLKPANVMIGADGHIKLTDFGLARRLRGRGEVDETITETLTREGSTAGTPAYMSPEQVTFGRVNTSSDVFSFGIVLHEMLTGCNPFRRSTIQQTVEAVLKEDPPPASSRRDEVPGWVDQLLAQMLTKEPPERCTAREVQTALKRRQIAAVPVTHWTRRRWRLPRAWMAAASLVLLSPLAWHYFWPAAERVDESVPHPMQPARPITVDSRFKGPADLSPDGNQVIYSALVEGDRTRGNMDVFVQKLSAGETPHNVTRLPGSELTPVWSPDGSQFAFVWVSPDLRERALYTISAPFGGREQKVTDLDGRLPRPYNKLEFAQWAYSLSWSADGQWLATEEKSSENQPWRIVLVSPVTREKNPLTNPPDEFAGDRSPALSPDGRQLAFVRSSEKSLAGGDIWLHSFEDEEVRQVTSEDYLWISNVDWTPDGREIVFSAWRINDPVHRLYRVSAVDGGTPQLVPTVGRGAEYPCIRGERLVFTQVEGYWFGRDIWRVPGPESETPGDLTPEPVIAGNPAKADEVQQISPDGRRIVFASDRTGHYEIWVADIGGLSDPKRLTWRERESYWPAWAPDGKRIVFSEAEWEGARYSNYWLHVIDSEGGNPPTRLVKGDKASWSHDGRWIYFFSEEGLSRMPPEGGKPELIANVRGMRPLESGNRRHLYYWRREDVEMVYRIPVAGGNEEPVHPIGASEVNWDLRGSRLYWVDWKSGKPSVHFLELDTGKVREWFPLPFPFVKSLAVAPDEKWVYYSGRNELKRDIYLLENFR